MTETSKRPSGRNFAPMPLAVLASEAPMRAKMLILALFHHDWDGEKAWPSQDRLAEIMSCSRDTVSEATKDCVKEGWIKTSRRFSDSNVYKMNVPGMTVQEFNAKIASRLSEIPTKANSRISRRESPHQLSEIPTSDAGNPGTNKNHSIRATEAEPSPGGPKTEDQKPSEKKEEKKTPFTELEYSEVGKFFKSAHLKALTVPYVFSEKDLEPYRKLPQFGLSDEQMKSSISAFFSPGSYHVKNGFWTFKHWVHQCQRYALAEAPDLKKAKEEMARYYEPWDPRHPHYKEGDLVQAQQRRYHESANGPWRPKPDWKPGGAA